MSVRQRLTLAIGIAHLGALTVLGPVSVVANELNGNEDFVPLATQGFMKAVDGDHPEGSRRNSYIWSVIWWKNKVYGGTVRDVLCLAGAANPFPGYEDVCSSAPTPGEIWSYAPGGESGIFGKWKRVYQSPMSLVAGAVGTEVPRDFGYRNMTACNAGGIERLYVTTLGVGGRILYTQFGITFVQASLLGLDLLNDIGYRAMVCWKGRLWISPAGTTMDPDAAFNKVLLVNDNPSNVFSPWKRVIDVANDPVLGDAGNVGIFSAAAFGDSLYLGVSNRTTGFQIWKANGANCNPPPGSCNLVWQKIIVNGGGRPISAGGTPNNAGVAHMTEYKGYLYAGVSESGFIKLTTAELIRIGLDDRWDLIVGEPRSPSEMAAYPNFNCNPGGSPPACLPLSGMGAGFDPPGPTPGHAPYIWRLQPHGNDFFAGTLDVSGFFGTPGPGAVLGFDLWRSPDGITWSKVTDNGFSNIFNLGVRNMASTPFGLIIGTANPFTIEDGTNGDTGGAEVWAGVGSCIPAAPPVAKAGPDQVLFDDENYPNPGNGAVTGNLDGTRSFDPLCGQIVSYQWYAGSLNGGSCELPALLPLAGTPTVSGLSLATGADVTTHTFTLQVIDSAGKAACDEVRIKASHNLWPTAIITTPVPSGSPPQVTLVDSDGNGSETVTISSSCSEPEGALASCVWSASSGVTIADPNSLTTTATVPVSTSAHSINLTAKDDHGYTRTAGVMVKVNPTP